MKLQGLTKAFTLIELLVVITIIGILGTGATTVYTSQIQKARDSNRLTDVKALQGAIEQAYADITEYPGVESAAVATSANYLENCESGDTTYNLSCLVQLGFIPAMPQDVKNGQSGANSALVYLYNVADSISGVNNQHYEVSVGFEAQGSLAAKAVNSKDNGNDQNRMELGHPTADISTAVTAICGGLNTSAAANSVALTGNCTLVAYEAPSGSTNADGMPVVIMK